MSESHHLPQDPAHWPNDPFKLLGIDRNADRRELRRAYSKLIRIYKPDDHPAEFERIRDAYHAAQQYTQDGDQSGYLPGPFQTGMEGTQPSWNRPPSPEQQQYDTPHDHANPQELSNQQYDSADTTDSLEPVPNHNGPPSFHLSLNEIWKDERLADRSTLYAELCQLLQEFPSAEETFVRLYWLLKLWPDLDESREPCQWLVDGLRACGVYGRLFDLYTREIGSHPEEGLSARFKSLIDNTNDSAFFSHLVSMRWQCAGRLKYWDTIVGELQDFRGHVRFDDHLAWNKLILSAADQLAWGRAEEAKKAFESCRAELQQCTTNDSELWNELERLDYLNELSSAWHTLLTRRGPDIGREYTLSDLTSLIRDAWCQPYQVIRPQFLNCLCTFVRHRRQALKSLDYIALISGTVIHHLRSSISSFSYHYGPPRSSANVDELVTDFQRFIDQHGQPWSEYRNQQQLRQYNVRIALLQFCLRRSLPPHMLVEHLTSSGYGIAYDPALDCLYEAHKMFWI